MLVAKIREHAERLQLASNENNMANATFDLDMVNTVVYLIFKMCDS